MTFSTIHSSMPEASEQCLPLRRLNWPLSSQGLDVNEVTKSGIDGLLVSHVGPLSSTQWANDEGTLQGKVSLLLKHIMFGAGRGVGWGGHPCAISAGRFQGSQGSLLVPGSSHLTVDL